MVRVVRRQRLLVAERHRRILETIAAEGSLELQAIAADLGVSVMTVRRDIRELSERGVLTVARGGATAQINPDQEILVNPRAMNQSLEKSSIGQLAATLIEAGDVVFIGTGSTTAQFVQFIDPRVDITVITSSLPHAAVLATKGMRVISTGGLVEGIDLAQSGPRAIDTIRRYYPSKAFVSAQGVSTTAGLTEAESAIADLNQAAIANSHSVILLADCTKMGVRSPYRVAELSRVTTCVTSAEGRRRLVELDHATGLEVLVPEA